MPVVDIPDVGSVEFPESMSQEDISSAAEELYLQQTMPGEFAASKQAQAEEVEDSGFIGQLWNDVLTRPVADLTKAASVGKQIQYLTGKRGVTMTEDDYPMWRSVQLTTLDRMAFPGGLTPGSFERHETFTDPKNPHYGEVDRNLKTYFDSRVKGQTLTSLALPVESMNQILAGELPEIPEQSPQKGDTAGQVIGGAVTGVENFVLGTIGFFTSPLGVVAPAVSAIGSKAKAATALGFAAMMGSHLPEQWSQFRDALAKGDTGTAAQVGTEGVLTLLGSGVAGAHGLAEGIKAFRGKPANPVEIVAPQTSEALKQSTEILKPEEVIPNEIIQPETMRPVEVTPEVQSVQGVEGVRPQPAPETSGRSAEAVRGPKYRAEVFQGRGKSLEEIYGEEAVKSGRAVPILGKGDYFAKTTEDAGIYGTVSKRSVELQNPIVIDSDSAWRNILQESDATVLDSRGREWYDHPERIAGAGDKVQSYLRSKGYDGAIIEVPMGDMNAKGESIKGLIESFGHDQVIKFGETSETQGAIATPGPALQPSTAPALLKTPKSQREIIADLAKGLKLPIRFGRLRTNRFAGYFQKVQNLIGSKKANDIPIVTHEVGHKLDAEFAIASEVSLRAELDALGDPSVPGSRSSWTPSKSRAYKLREGIAEFVRHWMTDPPHAKSTAPNTFAHFENILNANKDFGDTMRLAQNDIQTWRNAAPQARLRSHISVGENPNKTPYTVSQLTRDLVDDLHFLRLAVDDAKSFSGTELNPSENPYLLARNLRGSFGMAASFIRNGVADFKTKEVTLGTSLEHALKPVAGRVNDFRDWIVAKRAQELHAQGRETGLVDSDVQATASRFDSDPAFQEAFTKIKAWNDALLKYAVDAGMVAEGTPRVPATATTPEIPPTGSHAIREMNQDYVPFHRVFEVGAGEAPSSEGGGIGRGLNVGKPGSLKRLSGSTRDIIDPLETMVKNAYSVITAAEKQAISRGIADLSSKEGMGKWVEHIATPKERVQVGLDNVRKQLEDAGADLTNVPDDLMMAFFQNSKQAPFGENIIKVVKDGKPEFYRLKRELADTFNALDLEDSGTLLRMMAAPAQLLRAGVTLAPDFALANAIRDTFGAAVISKHGLLPFEATVRGVAAMLKNPKLIAEWEASGGKSAVEATYFDRAKLQTFLNEKITKDLTPRERALVVAKSPLTALRWLTGISEEATRIGEFQKAYKDLTKGGMPEGEARRMAAFEARDRQDFGKGGAKTKILRHMTAFWNAALQANVRLAQAFKERPFQTTLKGLVYVTIPKLIEQSINWDDEDYWDRPQWERDLFFLIPKGKDDHGHTEFLRIPTPFEIGIIFGTLPGRILQSIRENNPKAVKDFPLLMAKQTVPNPLPQTLQVTFADFLSGKKGWDIWRGRQVVPESIADLPPEMQWTEQTSLTAKKAGELLGFSPVKIDHIISGMSGGLGKQVTHQIVDRAISAATGEEMAERPVIPGSRFVTTPATASSESIDQFYNTLEELRTEVAGAKKEKTRPENKRWATLFEDRSRQISDIRKQMRQATVDSVKQQKAELILKIARDTMEKYRAGR